MIKKQADGRMQPVVVKMPTWLIEELRKKAGEKGISAHVRDLVFRDCASGRRRRAVA